MTKKLSPPHAGTSISDDRGLPASVIEQRPRLAEGVGTCYPTEHNQDAHLEWLAHVQAGRIAVR